MQSPRVNEGADGVRIGFKLHQRSGGAIPALGVGNPADHVGDLSRCRCVVSASRSSSLTARFLPFAIL